MKIAIFSKYTDSFTKTAVSKIAAFCKRKKIDTLVYKPANYEFDEFSGKTFKNYDELMNFSPDFLLSIGGDGTFLDSMLIVKKSGIPVVGINTGRLGFLANNQVDEIEEVINNLDKQEYLLEKRTVIELIPENNVFKEESYALNEFTIHKGSNSTLVTISTYVNNDFFNTYWCDGIILSTPTGSTAYSMSCGGPIVMPDSNTFILTPVAPHNLNVRPVIIPDHMELKFKITGRNKECVISLDSRFVLVEDEINFSLRKADFYLYTCRFNNQKFSKIIREKLNWGIDKRNSFE